MSGGQAVWVDAESCTGCGSCVEVCPVGAMSLLDGKVSLDEEVCTGCEACVDVCPESAIQPLVRGEIVTVRQRPAPAVVQTGPLAETAGVAVAAAGVSVLAEIAARLARAVGRWLARGLSEGRGPALATSSVKRRNSIRLPSEAERGSVATEPAPPPGSRGRAGRGRQARLRHRGG